MEKIVGQAGLFDLGIESRFVKEKFWTQTLNSALKIDLLLTRSRGVG